MKVKELLENLEGRDPEMEVSAIMQNPDEDEITDGDVMSVDLAYVAYGELRIDVGLKE
jgi:hypothetical protein